MHRSLVLYLPPEDPQAFREYYESTHIPLFKSVPGLRAFRYSFNVSAPEGESPYVASAEHTRGSEIAGGHTEIRHGGRRRRLVGRRRSLMRLPHLSLVWVLAAPGQRHAASFFRHLAQ
jgi:EthD domain